MTLEKQVVSIELSKKLKELGVKQDSLFYWVTTKPTDIKPTTIEWKGDIEWIRENISHTYITEQVSAFTVAELGEMLPKQIEYKVSDYGDRAGYRSLDLKCGKTIINDGWYVLYSDPHPSNLVPVYGTYETTEADARAKMLIYLIENKLITL